MILAGNVSMGYDTYYLVVKELKKQVFYYLFSQEPVRGDSSVLLQSINAISTVNKLDYLLEAIQRSKVTGGISKFGTINVIELILDRMNFAKSYSFDIADIAFNEKKLDAGKESITFSAADNKLVYTFSRTDDFFTTLYLKIDIFTIDLKEMPGMTFSINGLQFEEQTKAVKDQVLRATLKTITLNDLDNALDMSWYHKEDGKCLKNYSSVKTTYDFEHSVMTPIIKAAIASHEDSKPCVVSLDTETTGVHIYNLAEDNPDRSHCVSVQLSWEKDQGAAIFLDMEHFSNVPIEYVHKRLAELFSWYEGERTIEYYDDTTKTVTLKRNWFFLVGHNFPFDRRTMYQYKKTDIWFNADTLQMAFDINPSTVRGNNKLKMLTRRVFGHETPELTDVLGRGNEDKYKYLVDETVAIIYGCADVDYTRQLFFFLKDLMPQTMWVRYLQQDVVLSNILAISEYYGMMSYSDKVLELANVTYENIQILKRAAWSYVGAYMEYTSKRKQIEAAYVAGQYSSEDEYLSAVGSIVVDPNASYEFEFKGSSLRQVLYELLHYPIFAYTEGKNKLPKVDKYVIKKLIKQKRTANSTARRLEQDILAYGTDRVEYNRLLNGNEKDKKKAESMCLISAEKFNKLEYPLALIVQEHASLFKEYTSYYKPTIENNLEGKLFHSYSMARIETRRIQNPGQTMKGNLKALIRSYDDDHYILDFDMSQVEYRIMLSLAGFIEMIAKMTNPEMDYHTETASLVNRIPAHKVSKKVRKNTKCVSFGVPYGLGEMSLCESMFGEIDETTLFSTRVLLRNWKTSNKPIMSLLEQARDDALVEWKVSEELRNFMDAWQKDDEGNYLFDQFGYKVPKPLGRVVNKFGFYRVFDLSNVDLSDKAVQRRSTGKYTAAESSIRRKAGNYPIQSFAAEVFRIILTRFYWRCIKEGIGDKVIWHMLIHDELLCSVHKSIHPFFIYKIVKESCMITMPGHTKYFVGINIGDDWAACKDDAKEAPVYFVDRMIKRWDAGDFSPEKTPVEFLKNGNVAEGYWFEHPWDFISEYRKQYVEDRIGEVLQTICDIKHGPIDIPLILQKFDNYTVRAYVNDYNTNGFVSENDFKIGNGIVDTDAYDEAVWSKRLETWALNVFGEGKEFIDIDGQLKKLKRYTEEDKSTQQSVVVSTDEFADLFDNEDGFDDTDEIGWSLDGESLEEVYLSETYDATDIEEDPLDNLELDDKHVREAKSVAELVIKKPSYSNLRLFSQQIIIPYINTKQLKQFKNTLAMYKSSSGFTVVFKDCFNRLSRWITISAQTDLKELDEQLESLKQ